LSRSNSEEEKAENGFQDINLYGKGGLLENMYWVFITNAFLTPILAIFDPVYYMKLGFQWLAERKEKKGQKNTMTQKQAHILYEGPVMAMPTKYAGMIKIVLLATFYAPAIPFSLIYTIGGLILWYWADKVCLVTPHNVLIRYSMLYSDVWLNQMPLMMISQMPWLNISNGLLVPLL